MANIKVKDLVDRNISNISPTGAVLFSDDENFLELLTEVGLEDIKGGKANLNSCVQLLADSNQLGSKELKSSGSIFLSLNAPFAKDSPFSVLNTENKFLVLSTDTETFQLELSAIN
jgi:hypothetical protein